MGLRSGSDLVELWFTKGLFVGGGEAVAGARRWRSAEDGETAVVKVDDDGRHAVKLSL